MDAESEMIHHRMEETRNSLTEKLETLEHQVAETVHGANQAVNDSLETVKETVATVKDSVQETVASIKETFDLCLQVQRHPWALTGASVVVGYLVGCLQNRPTHMAEKMSEASRTPPTRMRPVFANRESNGNGNHPRGVAPESEALPAASAQSHWYSGLADALEPEMAKLKGLAVGTLAGVIRDMITEAAPEQMRSELADIIDHATVKVGGEPIRGNAWK